MILLIEDRLDRQQLFMNDAEIDLNSYSDILDNRTGEAYYSFLEKLKDNTFDLDKYSAIVSHKSAFDNENTEILKKLENHCRENNKPYILFSGGIDANYYEKSDYETIEINSKVFYSTHLKLFLDKVRNGEQNLLILIYGDKWKLNVLLNTLEKINLFIENTTSKSVVFKTFIRKTDYGYLEDVGIDIYRPDLNSNKVDLGEISKIRKDLKKYVERIIVDE